VPARLIVTAFFLAAAVASVTAVRLHALQITKAQSSVWGGVYTDMQAGRGESEYLKHCAACHRDDLSGFSTVPPLKGDTFLDTWSGRTADDLYTYIRTGMPPYNSVAIGRQTYIDIVAFIFKSNSMPPGANELTFDSALLSMVTISKRDAR
jgi:mono/diheme cytochrome c family protein